MQETVSAERLVSVVRVHADRVHDAVRRLGCGPAEAVEVVRASALDLVDAVAAGRAEDLLGWWAARARSLARAASSGAPVPVGEGVLAADQDQALLGRALGRLDEGARLALLLRDSYDLPAVAVGAALGLSADDAMEVVGRARLAFLPGIDGESSPALPGHAAELGALARIGEGGPVAARDATARKHAQACPSCRRVVEAQDYAHRLLGGLVVVALPDPRRAAVLDEVERAARGALPAAATLRVAEETDEVEDELPRRLLTPLGVLLGLVLAVAAGLGTGLLLVRSPGGISLAAAGAGIPLVTAPPVPRAVPPPPEQVRRAQSPPPAETRVFTIAPVVPTPEPPPETIPPSPPAAPLGITLSPASGPNGTELTVAGTGWTPGTTVTLTYLDPTGTATGSSATAVPDAQGAFSVALVAQDPQNVPGPHQVQAGDGASSAGATFDATP